jgi:leucyl aminopeptidase
VPATAGRLTGVRRTTVRPLVQLPEVALGAGDITSVEVSADVLLLPVAPAAEGEGVDPRDGTADAAARYGVDLADLADRVRATGAAGETATVELPRSSSRAVPLPWDRLPARLVLVGVGRGTTTDLRRAGAAVARATRGVGTAISLVGASAPDEGVTAFVEGYLLGAYRHPTAAAKPGPGPAERLVLLGGHRQQAVDLAVVAARATWTARVLTVTPSSTKSPAWVAERAVELATAAGLEHEVLDERALRAGGFGGLLAVGSGSQHEPRLVRVTWNPPAGRTPPAHVVVAGKGITYDTGGLSIKPRESMVAMKTDMAGSAVALATVLGAAELRVPHRVTALLALAENSFGAASCRPGDVITVRGGTTVEVSNTDAEGRLVLADALAHADLALEPDVLVDVATLTGAVALALGRTHAGLFTPDDRLGAALLDAGEATGERLWRLPLVDDYRGALDSAIADVHHVAEPGFTGAGSIVAALFLQRFAGTRRWAHLDIAGAARGASAVHEAPEGATGFGARLLLRWLSGAV